MDKAPANAERLTNSEYAAYIKTPSIYVSGASVDEVRHHCPRCKSPSEREHGVSTQCPKCRLNMLLYGNSLYVWDGYDGTQSSVDDTESDVKKKEKVGLLVKRLGECVRAIEMAMPREALGRDEEHGHYYRDELLHRAKKVLEEF